MAHSDGDHRVEHALGHLAPVAVEHGGRRHQVADVADQHQRPAAAGRAATVGRGERAIRVEPAGERRVRPCRPPRSRSPVISPSQLRYASALSALSTAAIESSKSMIDVSADSSTTSATPAVSVDADRVCAVDHDLDAQTVVLQQDRSRVAGGSPVSGDDWSGRRQCTVRAVAEA